MTKKNILIASLFIAIITCFASVNEAKAYINTYTVTVENRQCPPGSAREYMTITTWYVHIGGGGIVMDEPCYVNTKLCNNVEVEAGERPIGLVVDTITTTYTTAWWELLKSWDYYINVQHAIDTSQFVKTLTDFMIGNGVVPISEKDSIVTNGSLKDTMKVYEFDLSPWLIPIPVSNSSRTDIIVYPNPVSCAAGYITAKITNPSGFQVWFNISDINNYSSMGISPTTVTAGYFLNGDTYTIPINGLQPGIYYLSYKLVGSSSCYTWEPAVPFIITCQ